MDQIEIAPVFLEVLETHTASLPTNEYYIFGERIRERLAYGLRKYGRVLVTNEGRDSIQEAWEEAADGCQYLTKAYCEGRLPDAQLIHDQMNILLRLEGILQDG